MNNGYKEHYEAGHRLAAKNGMVYEHRLAAEKKIGRHLKPGEVVHHEDRNRSNNAPANIIVFHTNADHARYHASGLLSYLPDGSAVSQGLPKLTCEVCGKKIYSGKRCGQHKSLNTKIEWPDCRILEEMIDKSSVSEVARNLNVSGGAVKKHIKKYGTWRPRHYHGGRKH